MGDQGSMQGVVVGVADMAIGRESQGRIITYALGSCIGLSAFDPVAKVAMCNAERGNRNWLRKVRPISNHDYHFHVRLACPAGSVCQKQDPPPPGDGCAEAGEWIKNRIDPSRVTGSEARGTVDCMCLSCPDNVTLR